MSIYAVGVTFWTPAYSSVMKEVAAQTVHSVDGRLIPEFGAMISISDANHVTIEGLEFDNLIGNKSGIYVERACSNISICRNEIHNMHWTTDSAGSRVPSPSDNINPLVILGNSETPMTDISVSHNDIYDLTTGYSEAVKIVGNVDGFIVECNNVHDVTNIGIVAAGNYDWVGLADASLNHARNGVIRHNKTHKCVSPVADSAGIYVDGARDVPTKIQSGSRLVLNNLVKPMAFYYHATLQIKIHMQV